MKAGLHHLRVPRTPEWRSAKVAVIFGRRYHVVAIIDDPREAGLDVTLYPTDPPDPGWPLDFVRLDQVDWPGHGRCVLSDLVASGPGLQVRLVTVRMGVS